MNDVHTVLLSVAIVEKLELIWVCGWRVDMFFFSCGCWRKHGVYGQKLKLSINSVTCASCWDFYIRIGLTYCSCKQSVRGHGISTNTHAMPITYAKKTSKSYVSLAFHEATRNKLRSLYSSFRLKITLGYWMHTCCTSVVALWEPVFFGDHNVTNSMFWKLFVLSTMAQQP